MSRRVERVQINALCPLCGFAGTYTTQAMADHHFKQHKCQRWQDKAAKSRRGAARMAAVDRTPKACLHKIANHQHGTYACYTLDFCRCEPCCSAQHDYEQDRIRQQAYGRWDNYVDARPVRARVAELQRSGMGLKQIVKVSGISSGSLWKLMYGKKRADGSQVPSERVMKATAEKILAVNVAEANLAGGARIDATGTSRRLQALIAIGYSGSILAARLGMDRGNAGPLIHGRAGTTKARAEQVQALYEELAMKPAVGTDQRSRISVGRARRFARANGWPPPLAWDDDTIDDPRSTPGQETRQISSVDVDPVVVDRLLSADVVRHKLTLAERRAVVTEGHRRGLNDQQISARTGISDRTVLRIRQELNLPANEAAA